MTITKDNSMLIAAALQVTNPQLASGMDAASTWAAELEQQGARVTLFRQYEEGEHRSTITDQMKLMLRLPHDEANIQDLNDNYCKLIIDKMAGRLHVSEITTGDPSLDKQWLIPILEHVDFQAIQGPLFTGAVRDGDAFVMVDPQTLSWTVEPAYDGFSGMVVIMDMTGKIPIWACKLWSEATEGNTSEVVEGETSVPMRLVVYEATRITYWAGMSGGKEVMPDLRLEVQDLGNELSEAGKIVNELPWPVGVLPITRFANQATNFNAFGRSEIRAAIPLQDALNRTMYSMIMASEFSAFLIKWAKGIGIDPAGITPGAVINLLLKDANGNLSSELTENAIEFLKAVEVGQFEATDIMQYINQIDKLARELSQVTATPIYGVTTEGVLSGEALRQLEVGLISKVVRFQMDNTSAFRQLVKITALMQSNLRITVTGLPTPPEAIPVVSPNWQSPELIDTNASIEVLVRMRKDATGLWEDDFYRARIGALLRMKQSDIEKESEKARNSTLNMLESLVGAGGQTSPVA